MILQVRYRAKYESKGHCYRSNNYEIMQDRMVT